MTATARLVLLATALGTSLGAGPGRTVVVHGQGTALGETPILVRLDPPVTPGPCSLREIREGAGNPRPASILRDGGETYLAAVLEAVPASGEVRYRLEATPTGPGDRAAGIRVVAEGDDVAVRLDGALFTTYRARTGPKPFYYPLVGPTGRPITRSFPMADVPGEKRDHPHQRSLWLTHGKVNGIDFWSEIPGHGSIRETSRSIVDGAPAAGRIRTTDDWLGPDGKVVCNDERVVTFYATATGRVIDFDATVRADHGPVVFGDTKEGMFGVRVATSMDVASKGGGRITNSDGLTDEAAWGKPATWVDYSGPVDGETVGVAILNRPGSFRHPTTWHVRPYGLFAANPFGWHDFGKKESGDHAIPAGESIRFGYRVILHRGGVGAAGLPAAYDAYARPPRVEVTTD